jgi:hypothetical protein
MSSLDDSRDQSAADQAYQNTQTIADSIQQGQTPIGFDPSSQQGLAVLAELRDREVGQPSAAPAQAIVDHTSGAGGSRHIVHIPPNRLQTRHPEGGDNSPAGSSGITVHGSDGSTVENVNEITFAVADDPSANLIHVEDDGGGNVIVYIPLIPESPGGVVVLGDDDGATEWFPTDDCSA